MRPLVVHERPGVVAFASTALALTALEGVGHTLDVARAAEMLAIVPLPRTFVQGVRWLSPGAAMWIGDGGVRRWTWWNPDRHEVVDLGSSAAHSGIARSIACASRGAGFEPPSIAVSGAPPGRTTTGRMSWRNACLRPSRCAPVA
jgi:asparagine synthetase B (glutamine-hydrolysing)